MRLTGCAAPEGKGIHIRFRQEPMMCERSGPRQGRTKDLPNITY